MTHDPVDFLSSRYVCDFRESFLQVIELFCVHLPCIHIPKCIIVGIVPNAPTPVMLAKVLPYCTCLCLKIVWIASLRVWKWKCEFAFRPVWMFFAVEGTVSPWYP
jgi:hypothetical protein